MLCPLVVSICTLITSRVLAYSQAEEGERHCLFRSRPGSAEHENIEKLWTAYNVTLITVCAARCMGDVKCGSFLMRRSAKTCHGVSQNGASVRGQTRQRTTAGSRVYVRMCRPKGTVRESSAGNVCIVKSDCKDNDTMCHKGKCVCHPAFLYSISNQDCRKCTSTTDVFSWFHGYAIEGYNDRIVENVASPEQCPQLCVDESTFVCRSSEYIGSAIMAFLSHLKPKTCVLSRETYGSVAIRNRGTHEYGWILQLRNCL